MTDESVESLQAEERECRSRFQKRAAELRAQHADWSQQFAFSKACETLPRTLTRYMWIRQRLQLMGYPALPVR